MQPSLRERAASALGTAVIVALLGYLLFVGMAVDIGGQADRAIALLDLRVPAAPVRKPRPVERPKPGRAPSRTSPRNLRNAATPIVVPPPPVVLPMTSPVIVATMAGKGMAQSNGASNLAGPGSGAGGSGTGSGDGGDGDGGGDTPPRQIRGRLKYSDLPADLVDGGKSFALAVRYDVETDGSVGACAVTASSGSAELDALACRLIRERFRFRPSHDADGRPLVSTIEENHSWELDRSPEGSGR
jgi:protein TonB